MASVVTSLFVGFSEDSEVRRSLRFRLASLEPTLAFRSAETMDFHEILLLFRAYGAWTSSIGKTTGKEVTMVGFFSVEA